jgi:hypothetical protein
LITTHLLVGVAKRRTEGFRRYYIQPPRESRAVR